MYKLLIVDDEPLIQLGLQTILDYKKLDIELCGTASSGDEALKAISENEPDIVLMDINIPVVNGLEVIRQVRQQENEHPLFIILSSYREFAYAQAALKLNTLDYLVKVDLNAQTLESALLRAIERLKKCSCPTTVPSKHALKEYFFMKLLVNYFESETSIQDVMADLHLEFSGKSYACIYLDASQTSAPILSLCGLLNNLIQNHEQNFLMPWTAKSAILTTALDLPKEKQHAWLQEQAEYLRAMALRYFNAALHLGISSTVTLLSELSQALNESISAAGQCTDQTPIVCYSAVSKYADHLFDLSIIRHNLSEALENYDCAEFQKILSQVAELVRYHTHSVNQAISICLNVMYFTDSSYRGVTYVSQQILSQDSYFSTLLKCSTANQAAAQLERYADSVAAQLSNDFEQHKHWLIPGILKYVEDHHTQPLSLTDIASHFHVSNGYISSIFKKNSGMSFSECVAQVKIRHAKELLRLPNAKVSEVALQLGYTDPYYFSKIFKKYTGCSPTEYLRTAASQS